MIISLFLDVYSSDIQSLRLNINSPNDNGDSFNFSLDGKLIWDENIIPYAKNWADPIRRNIDYTSFPRKTFIFSEEEENKMTEILQKDKDMTNTKSLPFYFEIFSSIYQLTSLDEPFSSYDVKKHVIKNCPGVNITLKDVKKVVKALYKERDSVFEGFVAQPSYVKKGDKDVKVLFYYPGVRGKKLGMNYVVPVLESTISADKLKASLIGGEEEILYSNEESKCSKELYERLEALEGHNEKLNDLDEVLQRVLSSTKVVWVLNVVLKAFDTKDYIKSKLIEVYSDVKGFYS